MSIRLGLLSILILLASCQTPVGGSGSYKPTIPTLLAEPIRSGCVVQDKDGGELRMVCVTVTEHDWNTVVTELKAACLALGHSRSDCRAD